MRDKLMNCGVDYKDSHWADQPAAEKQAALNKPSSTLKDSKLVLSYLAAAQECIGQPRSFKDLSHGSQIVNRTRQACGGRSGSHLMATRANHHKAATNHSRIMRAIILSLFINNLSYQRLKIIVLSAGLIVRTTAMEAAYSQQ